ncbi:hypothetical protein OS493_027172 [Desmophyllum pertusum]|uniref:Uncharacterized protein n=1 Tax=Desmophyllum pertusum TaxID=174260 RepID=A0A9X0D9Q8_9CNID|nr:hypothetical protein OS493_027172 [Desmophyllum pertusum]
MQSTDFKNVSYDEELKRAKWFKDDLDKVSSCFCYPQRGGLVWAKSVLGNSERCLALVQTSGADGSVRATNGGNFTIIVPDEKDPAGASKMFGLTNNNYNGYLPENWKMYAFCPFQEVPDGFNRLREGIIEGYNKYFNNND